MIDERLDAIAPPHDDADGDLVAHLEDELDRRQRALQDGVAAVEACRSLLIEARRAAAELAPGLTLTIDVFLPNGLDPLSAATRQYLVDAYLGAPTREESDDGQG